MRPHRPQPTRLPLPWDSQGKNTGVGCRFPLQCMKVKSENEVAQSCPILSDPTDWSLQAPPSMGFSRQEYWSGVPLPSLIPKSDWLYSLQLKMEKPGRLQSMRSLSVGHDWATSLWLFTFVHWRRKWQPTPVFLPGESQGRGSLVGYRLWGHTELDMTDAT